MNETAAERPAGRVGASRIGTWAWFAAWAAVGAAAALGFVSFVLAILLVPVAAIGGLALAKLHAPDRSVTGLLTGAGIPLLVVAYIQRDGPGTTCWRTATGGGCTAHLDPRPWLVAGLLFVAAGIALCAAARHRARA